jgi:hypothetical protein
MFIIILLQRFSLSRQGFGTCIKIYASAGSIPARGGIILIIKRTAFEFTSPAFALTSYADVLTKTGFGFM